MTYRQLKQALALFGLEERASLQQIKARHRELAKRFHPDSGQSADDDAMRQVNEAYRQLLDYIRNYHYSFDEETFYDQCPEERLRKQYGEDPVWGNRS